MRSLISLFIFSAVIGSLVTVPRAAAQDDLVQKKRAEEIKQKDGWDFILTPGLSISFSDNRSVVGQTDGSTVTVGANLTAGTDWRMQKHQVRTRLQINETFNRNPEMERFIKSTDVFKAEGLYLFSIRKWIGPYGRASVDTFLLESFNRRAELTTWNIARTAGPEQRTGYELRLADGFSPLTLRESGGAFFLPQESKPVNVEFRLGFGGLHTFAQDALALKDDSATEVIEVVQLNSFHQAGGELATTVWGELYGKKLTYRASAEFMMPFVYDLEAGDDRGALDLTNIEFGIQVSFKVFDWMSIDYVLRAVRTPQLIDEFQVQNNLLLTASYAFFQPKKDAKK